jgi:hypothetical protein
MNDYTEKTVIPSHELFTALLSMLEEGHAAAFTVSGMSMWPFICHGRDQVVVEACDRDSLHVGDIILFRTPLGNYMLHRITALRPDAFETTGDGNCFRDGWFSRDCARAKVVTILRDGRKINCAAPGWRFVFNCWRLLFPVRRQLLYLLKKIGDFKAGVRRWKRRK